MSQWPRIHTDTNDIRNQKRDWFAVTFLNWYIDNQDQLINFTDQQLIDEFKRNLSGKGRVYDYSIKNE